MISDDWTTTAVAACFVAAANTLRCLPACEWECSGEPWLKTILDERGIPAAEGNGTLPPPEAMAALRQALTWTGWMTQAERELVWARAARVPWKRICADVGCDRTTAWRHWQLALAKIAGRLNAV